MPQPRLTSQSPDPVRTAYAPRHLAPADAGHQGVESPAVALQARLDAALSSSTWIRHDVPRWPGSARIAVLLGGAGASWALVWQVARLLLPA